MVYLVVWFCLGFLLCFVVFVGLIAISIFLSLLLLLDVGISIVTQTREYYLCLPRCRIPHMGDSWGGIWVNYNIFLHLDEFTESWKIHRFKNHDFYFYQLISSVYFPQDRWDRYNNRTYELCLVQFILHEWKVHKKSVKEHTLFSPYSSTEHNLIEWYY